MEKAAEPTLGRNRCRDRCVSTRIYTYIRVNTAHKKLTTISINVKFVYRYIYVRINTAHTKLMMVSVLLKVDDVACKFVDTG